MAKMGFFEKLKSGLAKTREILTTDIDVLILGRKDIDQNLYDELEELLITSDMGPQFTYALLDEVKSRVSRKELDDASQIKKIMQQRMLDILRPVDQPLTIIKGKPFVIMVIGVNGSGKTTTIGKLSCQLRSEGHDVMMAAADTFRAAAIEQLEVWGRRVGAPVIKQAMNADPAAVAFDAMGKIKAGFNGVMIIDTAGRLHTRTNLMEELKKIKRVIGREFPGAPHEILLVLDATTGQNAVAQAKMFKDDIGATGIVLTKLDGTSKGGVVVRIAGELGLPVRYIGVGEGVDDLRVFDSGEFTSALLD
ncbi:MAG: signal recognition particle-docking protein FtsY [Smithellaceae bacterium]